MDIDEVDDPPAGADSSARTVQAVLGPEVSGRLDRALAGHHALVAETVSRERVKSLLAAGAITRDGTEVRDGSAAARAGLYEVVLPAPEPAEPRPQALPLVVLWEDGDLIVVDKPAGMAAHPGPGTPDGTLVNALLHRCGPSLSGVGGVLRPGIVHRLDKETSGVMVAAKNDRAHAGLSRLFAAHDLDREYLALVRGAPEPRRGEVATRIGRSPHDRKKMTVLKAGGRDALTRYAVERTWRRGGGGEAVAARVRCRLETGRTHQIRVHMAHKGSPCLGDPTYGSGAPAAPVREALAASGLARQALHAAVLGFVHPVTGKALRFETEPPADMVRLEQELSARLNEP